MEGSNGSYGTLARPETVAGELGKRDYGNASEHLMAAYLELAPGEFLSYAEKVRGITWNNDAPNLMLEFWDYQKIKEVWAHPDDNSWSIAGPSLFKSSNLETSSWNKVAGPLSDPKLERMAVLYSQLLYESPYSNRATGALAMATDGMSDDKVKMLHERIQKINKERSPYPLPELPSVPTKNTDGQNQYLSLHARKVATAVTKGELDTARVDLAEAYLSLDSAKFASFIKEVSDGTSQYNKLNTHWLAGNMTDAEVDHRFTFETMFEGRLFKPETPPLADARLESIAVKYSSLLSQIHPEQISKALLRVAQGLPAEQSSLLLDRVQQINEEIAKSHCSCEGVVPSVNVDFKDSNGDGVKELESFKLMTDFRNSSLVHWFLGHNPSLGKTITVTAD